ncbi:MAG: hypothetical protein M0Z82_07735 [Actinomycetota bacterium]|nr:hypothetical protein [Actinomycetota bacterium]
MTARGGCWDYGTTRSGFLRLLEGGAQKIRDPHTLVLGYWADAPGQGAAPPARHAYVHQDGGRTCGVVVVARVGEAVYGSGAVVVAPVSEKPRLSGRNCVGRPRLPKALGAGPRGA